MVRDMEHDAEIEEIKRELALMQARYALYRRLARLWRSIFVLVAGAVAVAALVCAVKLLLFDWLYFLFFVAAVLLFAFATIWFGRASGLRWIDVASPQIWGIYNPAFFHPDRASQLRVRSNAELTERQIAACERRLRELGVPSADPNCK